MKGKLLTLLLGIVVGVGGTLVLPRLLGPLLPAGLRPGGESVEGTVVRRQRDEERLLLTINTPQGAALATFTQKVAEIDLLVEVGDALTLGMGGYEPFLDNPPIRAVRKAEPAAPPVVQVAPGAAPEPADPLPQPAIDQAPADEAPAADLPVEPAADVPAELDKFPGDGNGG